MAVPLSAIENYERLAAPFGCWPSFHDAEIIDLHYWRGDVKPGDWDDGNIFPMLTVKLLILKATQSNADACGADILAALRFHDVDDFKMDGFNHVNQIIDFSVRTEERGTFTDETKLPPQLVVTFVPGFGMSASFRCYRIEVLEAVPVG